jgi:Pro-kumamolisin, activation domain/Bacterial Ig-like domain (group 3)
MSRSRCTPPLVLSCLIAFAAAWLAATTVARAFAQAQPEAAIPNQITQAINPDERVTLQNNVHPLAQARYDQGPAPPSMATGRIMLVLKRSDMQEHALRQYLDELQNPNSANYHRWLTPEALGAQFGISDGDLATVTAWLQGQGFVISKVSAARNMILFSGNVTQIQQAFSTTIHRYVVNGETHFANATDPQIPAALAPVIAAVAPLNDFRPRAGAIKAGTAHYDAGANKIKPDITLCDTSGTCNILFAVPADAATIYDTPNSMLNANYSKISSAVGGKSYDGTGVTIGVVGDANIVAADVANYRAAFLPSSYSANQPTVIIDENDPGVNGDSTEALLDLQVAGGIAPGAAINFYTSADDGLASGLVLAIYRAIADNNISILNVSFGNCEPFLGTGGNSSLTQLWEQAAAQGITVTVATGDSGSAACDNDNDSSSAQFGLAVSGFASTPFNIAVGGTDYDALVDNFATYVSPTNTASKFYGTALSWIPENPWNDSTSVNTGSYMLNQPTMIESQTNIVGAGGGVSSCTQSAGQPPVVTCDPNTGYPTPAFQTGTKGFTFSNRTIPDVSLLAANGLYNVAWLICSDSQTRGSSATPTQMDCEQTGGQFTTSTTFTGEGGTSASAPAFAGMLALVEQSQGGARLGQANTVLYNLAAQSGLYGTVFHDVTAGNNSVVCTASTPKCGSNGFITDYNATANYDATSGLGSVDAAQLVANWTKATFTPTSTSFTINGATTPINVKHGTQLDLAASISPGAASGDVSFINNSGVSANQSLLLDYQTIASGKVDFTTGDLPGSSKPYNVYAYYGGDVKNAASMSNAVEVTISPESSNLLLAVAFTDPTSGAPICSDIVQGSPPCKGVSVPYGVETVISAQVKSTSGSNTPATGKITLTDTAGALPSSSVPVSSLGVASLSNVGYPNQSLPVASHGLTASYAGDGSYMASNSGSAYPFTITQGKTTVALMGSQSQNMLTITAEVDTDSVGMPPTGAVTFKVGSTTLGSVPAYTSFGNSALGPIASQYALVIPSNAAGLVSGDNTVTASYAGDTNYTASMGSGTVAVTGGGGSGFNINAPATLGVVAGVATANTGIVGVMSQSGYFTGTVALTCAISSGPTVAISAPTCALSPASVSLSGTLIVPSTLTISTTATTTLGAYVVTITGTGGGTTASGTTNLTVSSTNGQGNFSVAGTAVSVMAGATTGNASTVSVTPSGGFLGSVAMKCALSSSPMGAVSPPTCSIPASVLVGGTSAASTMMTVSSTPAMSGALSYPALFRGAGETALACLVMLAIPARRRAWRRFLGLIALAFAVSGVVACGGGGGSHNSGGTTAGSYTFTVTGTASSSGIVGGSSITASSTVQVMIN